MKKLLLSCLVVCAALSAYADDFVPVWSNSVEAMNDEQLVWSAPVSVDAEGSTIAAGVFNKEITLGSTTLTPIGNSSFVAKYDVSGNVKWAVGIIGAASVSAVDTDADGNVYVAGTYADEVTFGTTSGEEIVKEGQMIDGAPTSKLNSSFLAKYDSKGAVKAVQTFVPQYRAGLIETGGYWPSDGDCYFHINHLVVDQSGVYASAIYTGETIVGGAGFIGRYNFVWGMMYVDLKSTTVFKWDADQDRVTEIISCFPAEDEATDEAQFDASAVTFNVFGGNVCAVFAGNGNLTVGLANEPSTFVQYYAETPSQYNYIFAKDIYQGRASVHGQPCPAAGFETLYVPFAILSPDDNVNNAMVLGYESYAENYGGDQEVIGHEIFTIPNFGAQPNDKGTYRLNQGNVDYYAITACGIYPDATIAVSALGYYNDKQEGENGHNKGDFANQSRLVKLYPFAGMEPLQLQSNTYGFDMCDGFAAYSMVLRPGFLIFSLDGDPAGVNDVEVDNANAPVEYFNLQGVRVDNPANGLFIRRQAGNATKVLVK